MQDSQLVEKIIQDPENLSLLIDIYEKPLRRYLSRLLVYSRNDIDDVLQNVFIQIYVNIHKYNSEYKLSSWVYRIAHNQAIDHIRKNSKHKGSWFKNSDLELISSSIEDGSDSQIEAQDLLTKMEFLDDKYKDVLLLNVVEEKSYKEISDILKIPVSTVGSLVSRAKAKLREIVNGK